MLCLATNGAAHVQRQRLHNSGLDKDFAHIFISEKLQADKPSAAFYDACFAALPGIKREETVMVGDSRNDALAGRAAGVSVALVETGYNEGVSIADWAERRDSPASIRAQERCASGSWPQADCNLLKARILIDPRG